MTACIVVQSAAPNSQQPNHCRGDNAAISSFSMTSSDIPARLNTSITDNQVYPQVCLQAAYDYRYFLNFRREPTYVGALEHVPEKVGRFCLQLIQRNPEVAALLEEFRANDRYGNPITFEHETLGAMSATTLRYVRILIDLKHHFNALDDLNICEIGVGYGGQCRVVNVLWKPLSYQLVDIQPALALAQRFLDNFALHSTMRYRTMNELAISDYDLVISNYAFTELPRIIQETYLERVILSASRGYMIYNDITPPSFNSIKIDELLKRIPGSEVFPENPQTHRRNCVIVWGH